MCLDSQGCAAHCHAKYNDGDQPLITVELAARLLNAFPVNGESHNGQVRIMTLKH